MTTEEKITALIDKLIIDWAQNQITMAEYEQKMSLYCRQLKKIRKAMK